jgi:hypothetical protein
MNEKKITLDLNGKKINITISQATARMGIRRSLMIYAAFDTKEAAEKEGKPIDEEAYVISYRTLPDLVVGSKDVEGMNFPPTAEELLDLPEEFVNKWLDAIYKLNPHWNSRNVTKQDDEKKAES